MNGKLKPFVKAENILPHRDDFVKSLTDQGLSRKEALKTFYEKREEEVWINDEYKVDIDRNAPHHFSSVKVVALSVRRQDRQHIHDWRDMQAIKNALIGNEFEGFELYPAESRLYDSANQYWMWVFMTLDDRPIAIPIGMTGMRVVTDKPMFKNNYNRPLEEENGR